jgi:RNA polymerase sigma-70 factor (ECF subfamily)
MSQIAVNWDCQCGYHLECRSRLVVVNFISWRSLMIPRLPTANDEGLSSLNDESLVAQVSHGRQEAFTALYERHCGSLFHLARRILGDEGEAEEIVQEVFLEVYQRILQFDAQKGTFKSWLIRAAKHRSIDRKRHLQSRGIYDLLQIDEDVIANANPSGPMAPLSQQELDRLVQELLKTLPARERKVITLHFGCGLTLEEVRQEMKESISVVRRLYYGGLKKLQRGLSAKDQHPAGDGGNE